MSERYKVLLVEDDQVDRMAFERFVRIEQLPYDYTIASSLAEARIMLASEKFDVALLDYSLGDGTSIELFEVAQDLPIIMITGSSNLQIAVEVMKAGAYDFLAKDPDGSYLITLPITVQHTIERWQAQQELTRYRQHLEEVIEERTSAWLEGEIRLRTIVEATPTIVFSLDHDGKFTFAAGHTREILGFSPDELIGKFLFALYPETSPAPSVLQSNIFHDNFNHDVEINGHWLSISASARWKDDSKTITSITGVIHDISQRKQAELAVIQERNLLRTLIDNIPDYIFIKDREGRFIETNHAHAAGASRSREEILSHTANEVFDLKLAQQFETDDLYVLTNGKSITNEERITTGADGSKRWVLTTKVPLYDESRQNIIGLVGISRDITDRRRAEEERLQAERLRIEIEQERELVEMKQRFIATATHDFRTPLTIIKMSANTLEAYEDRLSPERRIAKLRQIQAQVDNMVHLVDDVLELSKATAGRVEFSPENFDLKPFCDRIWEDIVEMDQQQHGLNFEFTASARQIMADERLLQHILVNLLSNAFKYTPAGGDIEFQVASDDRFVTFSIRDSGYGIPELDQKHLFEPFYRAANVKSIEGTGLGLAIVKAYIELHGGSIKVYSDAGTGATFTAQLPVNGNFPRV